MNAKKNLSIAFFAATVALFSRCEKEPFTVDFDTKYVWVVGDNTVLYSNDAGTTWRNIIEEGAFESYDSLDLKLRHVYFFNTTAGYITAHSTSVFYFQTGNAYEWMAGPENNIVGTLVRVNVLGFASPENRNIYYITDDSFTKETVEYYESYGQVHADGQTYISRFYYTKLRILMFANEAEGWILADSTPQYSNLTVPIILSTTDSAKTWSRREFTSPSNIRASAISPPYPPTQYSKWLVGDHGTILRSYYLSETWSEISSGTTDSLCSICFPTPKMGFITGSNGLILKTDDYGQTWRSIASGTDETLTCISFMNDQTGIAVGKKGTMLITKNAGESWEPLNTIINHDLYSITFCKRKVFNQLN